MITHIQKFRRKLASHELCLGTGISLNDPAVVEALAPVVDFFWIDMEHNPMGVETLLGHLMAARAGGAPALVRVPTSDLAWVKRAVDAGVEGIIVPQVRSAKEVEQVVSACRFPPAGTRGWGPRRPSDYGRRSVQEVVCEANEGLFVAVQIEHVAAVEQIDAILAVPGLDSIAIGPFDLSGSMDLLGQLDHPRVVGAIREVTDKARRAGVYVGYGCEPRAENIQQAVGLGAQWIQCGSDWSYLLQTAQAIFAAVRNSAQETNK